MTRPTCPSPASLRLLFVLALAGYPIAGLLASWFDWDSTVASLPFRAVVVLLALWVLARSWPGASRLGPVRWLFAFWLIYLIRLVWDVAVAGVPGSLEALLFYVLTVLLPGAALVFHSRALTERRTTLLLVLVGAGISAAAVLMHTFEIGTERSLTEQTRRLSFEAVNPITLGHVAATTLIAMLCLTRRRMSAVGWAVLAPAALAALTCLVLAGSRGPMVALGLTVIVFAVATGRWHWLLILALLLLFQMSDQDSELWTRFAAIEDDESSLQRLVLQGNAIAQFLANPLLGSAFVELEMLNYPHNLFIETAMALGVVGLGVLLVVVYKSMAAAIRLARSGELLVPLLFVQYFIGAQLSGAIYGSAALWITVALLIGSTSARPATVPSRPRRAIRRRIVPAPLPSA